MTSKNTCLLNTRCVMREVTLQQISKGVAPLSKADNHLLEICCSVHLVHDQVL